MIPSDADQLDQFRRWFHSEAHRAYIDKVRENDGRVLDDEQAAWILFSRRWRQPDPPAGLKLHNLKGLEAATDAAWLARGWTPPRVDDMRVPDSYWDDPKAKDSAA